ncbi:MAG TPA: bile acid:sodium symporter family protein [Polyangiaceae bacterium]
MPRRLDWFLIGMGVAVALAWVFPEAGAKGGVLRPELITKIGVALIFFLHGLGLPFQALKAGTLNWPVHVIVQTTTFVVFPLIGLVLFVLGDGLIAPDLRIGIFYLCALPSTVSSSVALTAAARGNVPAALLNATLSSVIGIVITPLWLALVLGSSGHALPLGKVVLDLVTWLLLPLALGQLARPWLGELARVHRARIAVADRLVILLLVYTSFCDSVQAGVWQSQGIETALLCAALSLVLLVSVLCGVSLVCRAVRLPIEDRIAAVFCGSKKTLASGVPMARLIFGAHPGLGLILLPILIYHAVQLFVCGWLAGRWSRRPE